MRSRAVDRVEPIAGPRFRDACAAPVDGEKRRRLLALVAAYQDADPTYKPTVRELAERLGLLHDGARRKQRHRAVQVVDALLARLEQDGWLSVAREPQQRSVYTLRLDRARGTEDGRPTSASPYDTTGEWA